MAATRRASAPAPAAARGPERGRPLPCPAGVSACVFCGPEHPTGLHVRFLARDGRVAATFRPRRGHQGFHGLMSGGLLAGIFDCLHYRIPVLHGVSDAVTARVEVHYRAPIPLGRPVRFEAALVARRGRVFDTRAWAWLPDGTLAAESTAVYVEVPAERLPRAARRAGAGRRPGRPGRAS